MHALPFQTTPSLENEALAKTSVYLVCRMALILVVQPYPNLTYCHLVLCYHPVYLVRAAVKFWNRLK